MKSIEGIRCLLAAWIGMTGCSPQPQACARVDTCPSSYECLANRCAPSGGTPVAADTVRLVRTPTQVRVIGSQPSEDRIPPTVTFGDPTSGDPQLHLTFAAVPRSFRISAAFLLLDPAIPTAPARGDIKIGLRADPSSTHGDESAALSSATIGIARAGSEYPLRIDVSELVRALQTRSTSDLSFIVGAEDTVLGGVTYQIGSSGSLPTLEVYGYSTSAKPRASSDRPEPSPAEHASTEL